jgi:hypothetical protein
MTIARGRHLGSVGKNDLLGGAIVQYGEIGGRSVRNRLTCRIEPPEV